MKANKIPMHHALIGGKVRHYMDASDTSDRSMLVRPVFIVNKYIVTKLMLGSKTKRRTLVTETKRKNDIIYRRDWRRWCIKSWSV